MISCRCILMSEKHNRKGVLELSEYKLVFSISKGFLRKGKFIIREISLTDITDVKYSNAELAVTWKGPYTIRDIFVAEKGEQETLTSLVNSLKETLWKIEMEKKAEMEKRRREELMRKTEEKRKETIQIYSKLVEAIDAFLGF